MVYELCNLSLLLAGWLATLVLIDVFFDPPMWLYVMLLPVTLVLWGVLVERVFSYAVNSLIDRCRRHE